MYCALIAGLHHSHDTQRPLQTLRACLRGGGGPKVGEVTRLGGVKK